MTDHDHLLKRAADILQHPSPLLDPQELRAFVDTFFQRRQEFLDIGRRHGSPLYIIDEGALVNRAGRFLEAFRSELPGMKPFFALKSNNCPIIAGILAGAGLGLDVSSGVELRTALSFADTEIIFSGPGKTPAELDLAVAHRDRVTVLMDSFGELQRLELAAARANAEIRAGVRLCADEQGLWRKFGILLDELPRFMDAAETCPHVVFQGLQFHTSWNMNPDNHIAFIIRLGAAMRQLPEAKKRQLRFIDIGGGYWPEYGEWLQAAGTPEGGLHRAMAGGMDRSLQHYRFPSTPIEVYARGIGQTIRSEILTHCDCTIYAEPGRWLCHDGMHLLLTVIDKKSADLVITDAGTNAIGWERFENDYFPVLNLSRPDLTERSCLVLGSLCTPHDVWGYGYFGEDIQPGDLLLIPTQGAYTYSLRQNFIKPLPETAVIPARR